MMAAMLKDELTARGITVLKSSDYNEIVERLVEQVTEMELKLAARQVAEKPQG